MTLMGRLNVTLAIEEELLQAARAVAAQRQTSVNDMVRQYLKQVVGEDRRRRAAWEQIRGLMEQPPVARDPAGTNCMRGDLETFVDTNVLVYAVSRDESEKQEKARAIVERGFSEGCFAVSTQVLLELYVNFTRKARIQLPAQEAFEYVRARRGSVCCFTLA